MLNHIRPNKSLKEFKGLARQLTNTGSEYEDHNLLITDLEAELQRELQREQEHTRILQETLKENQDIFVKKEQNNRKTLNDLEEKLRGGSRNNDTNLLPKTLKNMEKIQEFHSEIMQRLGLVQHKTIQIMIDQEKELIKEYKDKFVNVEDEISDLRLQSPNKLKQPERKDLDL